MPARDIAQQREIRRSLKRLKLDQEGLALPRNELENNQQL